MPRCTSSLGTPEAGQVQAILPDLTADSAP
jgi:hypothetical protein